MGSHSITCHPTQANSPRLTPAMQAGTRFTYPGRMEGWVDLVDLIVIIVVTIWLSDNTRVPTGPAKSWIWIKMRRKLRKVLNLASFFLKNQVVESVTYLPNPNSQIQQLFVAGSQGQRCWLLNFSLSLMTEYMTVKLSCHWLLNHQCKLYQWSHQGLFHCFTGSSTLCYWVPEIPLF